MDPDDDMMEGAVIAILIFALGVVAGAVPLATAWLLWG